MKNILAVLLSFFFVLSSFGQSNDFGFSKKALKSKEFKDLKLAYTTYLEYSKTHNSKTAYQQNLKRENIQDTVVKYALVSDSLSRVMKSKSKLFYSKFSRKDSVWTESQIEEFKAFLADN